jgi:hypothetical protein
VTYGVFKMKNGCEYRSLDCQSGLRAYESGAWFGGQHYALTSALVGEPVEVEVFPADVQEYDGYPSLDDAIVRGIGRRPRVISTDRASYTRPFYEYNTRRGVAVVAPERKLVGKPTHGSWRTERWDEDGVPRCAACGGPGNQSAPGLGLVFVRGEPVIRFRCMLPLRPACYQVQQVACAHEFLKLTPLSQLLELPHAIAERHGPHERVFRHTRQRWKVAGKELAERLPTHRGVSAQRLRAHASLFWLWFRLNLRNGWLSPIQAPITPNERQPVRLSGRHDRRSGALLEPGIGATRLQELRRDRERSGLEFPLRSWRSSDD